MKTPGLSRLRDASGQLGMASLSPHVPEIALSSQPAAQACRGFWALIPECRWASVNSAVLEGDMDLGAMPTWPHPQVFASALPPACFLHLWE